MTLYIGWHRRYRCTVCRCSSCHVHNSCWLSTCPMWYCSRKWSRRVTSWRECSWLLELCHWHFFWWLPLCFHKSYGWSGDCHWRKSRRDRREGCRWKNTKIFWLCNAIYDSMIRLGCRKSQFSRDFACWCRLPSSNNSSQNSRRLIIRLQWLVNWAHFS